VSTRQHNLAVVLSHLRRAGPRSRAKVAEETGLNRATVSSLVADLKRRDLVAEGPTERGGVGRPGQVIELDGRRVWAIGAEVNVGFVAALAMNLRGEVGPRSRLFLDTARLSPEEVLTRLCDVVWRAMPADPGGDVVPVGLAVAVPGLVDRTSGLVTFAPNLGWRSVPLVDTLRGLLEEPPYPVVLGNDASFAALAELQPRRLAGTDLLLVTGMAGVGGGVVADGRLLRGGRGFAGEVGHVQVDPGGRPCACGRRGCWETLVGLHALLADAADPDDWVRDTSIGVEARLAEVVRRAAAGDDRTIDAITHVGSWLGVGAGTLVDVLNPDVLVLGGYYGALATWLSGVVRRSLEANTFARGAGGCTVEFSTLGFEGPLRGGAQAVLEGIFEDPTVVRQVRDVAAPSVVVGDRFETTLRQLTWR
jgi:predicted NBD/HSP70 family sugar kinase